MLRFKIILLVLSMLCACQQQPVRNVRYSIQDLPQQWTAISNLPPPLAHWSQTFADSMLNDLLASALRDNYDLRATAARIKATKQQAVIEGATRLPQISMIPSYLNSGTGDKASNGPNEGAFSALFSFSWELDLWGRIAESQQAALFDTKASTNDYQAARLSLAARCAQSYYALLEAKWQESVVRQSIQDRRIIVELVRGRFKRGLTRGLDLRLALTDLANAEAQLAETHNQVQSSTRRLETLLGRYPANLLSVHGLLPALTTPLAADLPSALLERRPDIQAAFDRLLAQDARLSSAQKFKLPRITLTASGGTRSPALTELADPRAAAWNLLMGLTQPLYAGGRISGGIELAKANVEEALQNLRSVTLNAFQEVEQSLAAEQWLREQERQLKNAVDQTVESRKMAIYSYRQGQIEILTLLDSYRSTLSAQSAHLSVQRQLLHNRINLYLALGGEV